MGWWNWPGWPTASEWSAWWAFLALLPSVVAGVAAVAAVWIARRQLGELIRSNDELRHANDAASRSNLAVSRPYVTVDLEAVKREAREPATQLDGYVQIVIQNDGRSPARDVSFTVSPPFASAHLNWIEGGQDRHRNNLRSAFSGEVQYSVLRPGRRFSLLLDKLPEMLSDDNLPRQYRVQVRYSTIDLAHSFVDEYTLIPEILGPAILETDWPRRISKDIQALTAAVKARE